MKWGDRIKHKRESLTLKPAEFARLIGVSAPTVSDWESGAIKKIEGGNLIKAARALRTTAEWIITGTGEDAKDYPEPAISEGARALLDQWAKLRESQQRALLAQIDAMISDNLTAIEELTRIGLAPGKAKPKKQPGELIDPTLPDPNEFTTFANKRADGERRTRQIEVEHDRRENDRRNK